MTTTVFRNAAWLVAWDEARATHVYRRDVDLAINGSDIVFLGKGYGGVADTEIECSQRLLLPGLVNIHSHPSSEALNKGFLDELGSPALYNSSLYEFMPILRPDAETVPDCVQVAYSELLLSGVTTLADLSVAHPDWS